MDYAQFKNLLELKDIDKKESVSMLEDVIEKFPYFQSARLLLAKSMHEQGDINYNEALKLAAAYSTDREALRELVERQNGVSPRSFPPPNDVIASEAKQSLVTEEPYEEYYSEDEISGRAFEEQKEKEKIVDPYEVIRKRLSEILVVKEEPEKSKKQETRDKNQESPTEPLPIESPASPVKEETVVNEKSDSENIIIQEAGKAHDVLDRMEVEHAMEESILASLEKLPVIAPEEPSAPIPQFEERTISIKEEASVTPTRFETSSGFSGESDTKGAKSFTKWLKSISAKPFHNYEEVHIAPNPPKAEDGRNLFSEDSEEVAVSHSGDKGVKDLIDRFIAAEPRIIPSKAEFYSPANQARKSVMENEDVVSETLARIYREQGNLAKAKWCYEKLSLLHPEKSVYFAALIEEIKNEELKIKN
jgi:hypothetical protein